LKATENSAKESGEMAEFLGVNMEGIVEKAEETGSSYGEMVKDGQEVMLLNQSMGETIDEINNKPPTFSEVMVSTTSAIMGVASALSSLGSLSDIWKDEDISTGEKVIATLTTMMSVFSALNAVKEAYVVIEGLVSAATQSTTAKQLLAIPV
jgi:methyl-accepting chemotaxis protein